MEPIHSTFSSAPASASYARSNKTSAASSLDKDEEHVRVVVRVRPLNAREQCGFDGAQGIICLGDGKTVTVNQETGPKNMTYDSVYSESTMQNVVYEESGIINLVDAASKGFSATVFAFGQTGSGKTYTMTGPPGPLDPQSQGVIPRALCHLFQVIASDTRTKFTVRAAYFEIYNESVQDLLNPTALSLPVRWQRDRGFYVENLFVVECEVLDDCLAVLEEGLRNRTTGSHALNDRSSRSHSILTVYIESEDELSVSTTPGVTTPVVYDARPMQKFGKISFVDLAGSERVKESKATGDTLTETGNINRSLLALGSCISALSDPKRKQGHIPYRDSKLTKLLMDSLGGKGLALMIACISPNLQTIVETIQTLRYASRAKRIHNRPSVCLDPREELILKLKKEVKRLRDENKQLQSMMQPGVALIKDAADSKSMTSIVPRSVVEMDSLRYENMQLAIAKQQTDHAFANLMRENETLREAIDRFGGRGLPLNTGSSNSLLLASGPNSSDNKTKYPKGRKSSQSFSTASTSSRVSSRQDFSPKLNSGSPQSHPVDSKQASANERRVTKLPMLVKPGKSPTNTSHGIIPDLHSLRADVNRLDAEIAKLTA